MGSSKRLFRLVLMATLAGIFAVPPQVMRGQDAGDAKRKVRTQIAPAYPELAKRMNVHGKVRLEVTVAADGSVKSVHAVGGHPLLVSASQDAVRNWKFEPGPKETVQVIEVNFD
ncbi:MAG TPA: energy transducer TonB [Candidatus Acidoferrales bacterium]|nr:energy transducer TonB [Candidatus Acidoferrales bacterium]